MSQSGAALGVVVIGRNEGERLLRCLASLAPSRAPVVYVDSGSTDGSVEAARARGCTVVVLDRDVPFTAARARNAGYERLVADHPTVELVQFVDGDCEVDAGWLARAAAELARDPRVGVVCGRRRERFPERSVYNLICDVEWDGPAGDALFCGGDAMMRVSAFEQAGRFDPTLIAGEEPELCVRIRAKGWRIVRIAAEMTLHDAAMTRASQWWRRAVRAGHAYAEVSALHGAPPERMWVRKNLSIAFWAVALPVAIAALAWPTRGATLLLLGGYPVSLLRNYRGTLRRGRSPREARAWAVSCLLANVPLAVGQATYLVHRLRRRPSELIEYKGA